jgi:hypothetical protein
MSDPTQQDIDEIWNTPALPKGMYGPPTPSEAKAADLASSLANMTKFKKDIDNVLKEFNASPAAPGKVGADKLDRTSLGGGGTTFHEANFLYDSYSNVHSQLENLSTVLGLQIESVGLAIETSGKDIADLDDDVKARMQKLNTQIQAYYEPSRDPYAKSAKGTKAERATNGYGSDGSQGE